MYLLTFFGVLLSTALLNTFVHGDANHCLTLSKLECETLDNEYFGSFDCSYKNSGQNSKLTISIPVKKDIPPEIELALSFTLDDNDPMDTTMGLCDCMEDKTMGENFIKAITPEYTPTCPIPEGTITSVDFTPSLSAVPSGVDGQMTGIGTIGTEDNVMVKLSFAGNLMHGFQCN